jgi:hypothetical protein
MGMGLLPRIAGAAFSPYNFLRNPRRGCGSTSPFVPSLGYSSARGYQYDLPKIESGSQSQSKRFSFKDLLLEMVIGGVTGGLSSAAFYGAGKGIERLIDGLRPSKGSGKYDLYRKDSNTGRYKDLEELMQLKNVKNVANKAGVGLDGIKVKIDRNPELLGRNVYGYTDGKTITLYPDAFIDTETLVKTLGHERTHVYQVGVFGKPTSTDMLREFERGASASEQGWWDYFNLRNGGR